ncbi:MAG: flagellar basal-body MS-ring/collar protein FliF [Pseudomonadota bacterium]
MDNANVIEGTVVPANQVNLNGVLKIPAVRQVFLLFGVALAIAAGFAVVLWSWTPAYVPLYSGIGAPDSASVAEALRASDIDFKIDSASGEVLVPQDSLHQARIQLASQGVGSPAASGMASLQETSGLGTSQFLETARYQHALETELARTISSLGAVREARVHLGLPKQSSFVRDQNTATASVVLHLLGGHVLESDKASAIINLVASSVPNLNPNNVTLIDQFGRLFNFGDDASASAKADSQFRYARRLEETYRSRIEQILTPVVGAGRVRAQVDADVDFTIAEEAAESFDPANSVVRSEQTSEDIRQGENATGGGIPGALSNQPPETGAQGVDATDDTASEVVNSTRSSVRNFEVDRVIRHTQTQVGSINRLSVAVLIDVRAPAVAGEDATAEGEDAVGETPEAALTDAEIAQYEALVREAVGFNEARGDSVMVMGAEFRDPPVIEPAAEPAIWEQPIVREILKQVLGAALALALLLGVIRPLLRGILAGDASGGTASAGAVSVVPATGLPPVGEAVPVAAPNFDEKVAAIKSISGTDPARVAQVVKQWVNDDG